MSELVCVDCICTLDLLESVHQLHLTNFFSTFLHFVEKRQRLHAISSAVYSLKKFTGTNLKCLFKLHYVSMF